MKRLLVTIFTLTVLILTSCSSNETTTVEQTNYVKDGIFYTTLTNGIGNKIPMRFKIDDKVLSKIKSTNVEDFLKKICFDASFDLKYSLKNKASYNPISDGYGSILVTDDFLKKQLNLNDDQFYVTIPYTAQNGFGNTIIDVYTFVTK